MKWYYQFTPHNVWDWDAQQPTPLLDVVWNGQPRKVLIQASRNGFFYVIDRTDGELLLAKRFAQRLTWASGLEPDGRPILNPNQIPTEEGTSICPSSHGAANWYSTAYSPLTYSSQTVTFVPIGIPRAVGDQYPGDCRLHASSSIFSARQMRRPRGPSSGLMAAMTTAQWRGSRAPVRFRAFLPGDS